MVTNVHWRLDARKCPGIKNCKKQLWPPKTGEQVCLYRVAWQKGSRGLGLHL